MVKRHAFLRKYFDECTVFQFFANHFISINQLAFSNWESKKCVFTFHINLSGNVENLSKRNLNRRDSLCTSIRIDDVRFSGKNQNFIAKA